MRLVADIGGTNARLALADQGAIVPHSVQSFANQDWQHLYPIIQSYLEHHQAQPDDIVLAVAGPVAGGTARLTNRDWTITCPELIAQFGFKAAYLINDLSALGYAVPSLTPSQRQVLWSQQSIAQHSSQSLVVGIGTGFNVSPVLQTAQVTQCLSAEMGHVAMPMAVAQSVQGVLGTAQPFPTVEHLFSGRGFEAFCRQMTGQPKINGKDVIAGYGQDSILAKAVDTYGSLLGQLLRELTLAYMPSGGIFLAGSVARAVATTATQACVTIYEKPYHISGTKPSGLYVITDDFAALNGCAQFGRSASPQKGELEIA